MSAGMHKEKTFQTAMDKWCTASANGLSVTEVKRFYNSLVEALEKVPGNIDESGRKTKELSELELVWHFLKTENQHMDSCVRWYLLDQVIDSMGTSSAMPSNANLQLAQIILKCGSNGENLIFFPRRGEILKKQCYLSKVKQLPKIDNTTNAKKQEGKLGEAPGGDGAKTSNSVHSFSGGGMASLFVKAVRSGNPHVGTLLKAVQELLSYKGEAHKMARLARHCVEKRMIHTEIVNAHGTALPVFKQMLSTVPDFLWKDDQLLDRVIDDPLPDLAIVILASDHHAEFLTTHQRIVRAISKWMAEAQTPRDVQPAVHPSKGHDDDDGSNYDDDVVDEDTQEGGQEPKKDQRRSLALKALANAPVKVLQSPEVLMELMRYNLLENKDVKRAYSSHCAVTPFTFASFLNKVPGILHMAVLYQQQPLVETLLRTAQSMAVTRDYVRISTDGSTFPKMSTKTTTGTVNGASSVPLDKREGGHYPLWFNNEATRPGGPHPVQPKDDAKWERIRSALIYCTMKHAQNMETLLTILRDSGEPENEITFDMSRLPIEGTSVAEFVTAMPRPARNHNLIRYEETIRYAEFPVLDRNMPLQTPVVRNPQNSYLESTHREVLDMLNWLYDHGVRRIITLRVPDRMAQPHDELEIVAVVRRFRVEVLDWRILDLSLSIFQPYGRLNNIPLVCRDENDKANKTKTNSGTAEDNKAYLRELHLYTGGRRSALDHWFSTEGLQATNLEKVHIHVINELATREQSNATIKLIRSRANELKDRLKNHEPPVKMEINVQPQFWKTQTETPRLQEIIHRLSPCLATFIAHYRQITEDYHDPKHPFQPVKVAIIDNGILGLGTPNTSQVPGQTAAASDAHSNNSNNSSSSNSSEQHLNSQDFFTADSLWSRICEGKSFVNDRDRRSPWFLASNPHGTQMANLVCAIDPLCQLFVAKIADSHYGYSAARAADAVNWAIEKKVDIISMSFTTTESNNEFEKAVRAAMEAGIVVVCSHHDEGARSSTYVFPAGFGGRPRDAMLRMASCNMYGKLLYDWDDNTNDKTIEKSSQYDFCINSEKIDVGTIPFIAKPSDKISGSSVATAIAAGVCSLLIACLRTLKAMPPASCSSIPEKDFEKIQQEVSNALEENYNRPTFAMIKSYLGTMALSDTNKQFISLDRFARLDHLRDHNTTSLEEALLDLGKTFCTKR